MLRLLKPGSYLKSNNINKKVKQNVYNQILKCESRCVATQSSKRDNLFPERVDFPQRHIGPRDQDIVTMLDLLGYKVIFNSK